MTRTAILLRHGHAGSAADDYARTLTEAGIVAAQAASQRLAAEGLAVERVLTSSAPRALQTAQIAAEALGLRDELESSRGLYLASRTRLLATLRQLPETARSVLLVGHNPGMSELAEALGGTSAPLAPARYVVVRSAIAAWSQLNE